MAEKRADDTVVFPPEHRMRGLLVGINRYINLPPENQLHGCVQDTINVRNVLTEVYGARQDDIRLIHDERATKRAILDRLAQLVRDTRPGDVAVLHFSSHGALLTERERSGALKNHASEILCLSTITPTIDDPDSYISDSELTAALSGLHPAALLVVFLDACHSGASRIARAIGIMDSSESEPARKPRHLPIPEDLAHRDEARLNMHSGADDRHRLFGRAVATIDAHVLVLTACGPNQTSDDAPFLRDGEERFEGAFTHFLCESLRGAPDATYGQLTTSVRRALHADNDNQTPEFTPAAFIEAPVLQPLPSRQPAAVDLNGEITVRRGAQPVHRQSLSTANDVTTDDPRLASVLSDLKASGFTVQPAVQEGDFTDPNLGQIEVTMEEGFGAFLLEYDDGLVIWHRSVEDKTGRSLGDATELASSTLDNPLTPGQRRLVFHFHPLPVAAQDRKRGLGGVLGRIFHVITYPVEFLTHAVLKAAESLVFKEGLYLYPGKSFSKNARMEIPGQLTVPPDGVVLFIHGVLSSVEGCFGKRGSVVPKLLKDLHKRNLVLGYNHLSATVSIEEIAFELDTRLRACIPEDTPIRIVAHSQGGDIARQLATLRRIDRIVAFGSPLQGTHLANRLEKFFTVISNMSSFFGAGALKFIGKLLQALDNPAVIPGFLELKVDSDFLKKLDEETPKVTCAYFPGCSDFRPDGSDSELTRLAERVEQWGLFPGKNDLVIDTSKMDPPSPAVIQGDLAFSPNDHVTHVDYFLKTRTLHFLREALL